ncbi:hypothetical protein [Phenylobacterium sp.]|uniref:hypothetical protein n=1 Tax=Phenylobacterium sp. TaxID=1871053 RepID=UPI0025DCC3F6|nr:hypothetical protein [Phenylobacterium sp.]
MSSAAARVMLLAVGAALALGGCQTLRRHKPVPPVAEPAPLPQPAPPPPRVLVLPRPAPTPTAPPPPKACVPRTLAPPPRYPDTDAALRASPGAADRYQLMAAGRILREQRLEDLERIVAACRAP